MEELLICKIVIIMKEIPKNITSPSPWTGRKPSKPRYGNVLECLFRRTSKKEQMEAWPTSPVLSEEKNAKEKEKAHKHYERQLKAGSWYSKIPERPWIEVVEPFEGSGESCSECCFEEPCGCILVSNQPMYNVGGQRRLTVESGRSSFGDALCVEARTSRASKTSTEDEKSFYDNLCQFCKFTSLERRARKYGEWRRRWSAKVAELRADTEPQACTCAMDNLSFIEWKRLFEQEELVMFSKVDCDHERTEVLSTSDYGTQKSKDSDSTVACREYPVCLTVKSSSLGYNSASSIPNTEQELDTDSSYSPTDASDSEESGNEIDGFASHDVRGRRPTSLNRLMSPRGSAKMTHTFHGLRENGERFRDDDDVFGDKLLWIHQQNNGFEQMANAKCKTKNEKDRTYRSSKAHSHRTHPKLRKGTKDKTSAKLPKKMTSSTERRTSYSEGSTLCSEGETSYSEDKKSCVGDDGSVTPTEGDTSPKIPTENDETFPADLLSEFVAIAKSIDEFYESIHAQKFLENRVDATSRDSHVSSLAKSRDSIDGETEKTKDFSLELKKRIRSLERLCSFVELSDDETFDRAVSPEGENRQLSLIDKEEQPVWRLSQQSINLTLARRSRSNTSSGSSTGHSRCPSTSGSGSSNSRCSTRQSNSRNGKPVGTSMENIRSPDSGFSEQAGSLSEISSPKACQLGTKWAGSMQWDYTDWFFYYGYDCNGNEALEKGDKKLTTKGDKSLTTIHEAPPARPVIPQNPLDWDW